MNSGVVSFHLESRGRIVLWAFSHEYSLVLPNETRCTVADFKIVMQVASYLKDAVGTHLARNGLDQETSPFAV
jgi:hypothetical protein